MVFSVYKTVQWTGMGEYKVYWLKNDPLINTCAFSMMQCQFCGHSFDAVGANSSNITVAIQKAKR